MGGHPVHEALTSPYITDMIKIKAKELHRRPEFRGIDPADTRQSLATQVVQQAHLFDPNRGAVTTFIAMVLKTAAAMLRRDILRAKRGGGVRPQSLEGSALQSDREGRSLLDVLLESDLHRRRGDPNLSDLDRHVLQLDVQETLAGFKPDLRRAALLLMQDATELSMAEELGCSRRQVRKAIREIRRRLRLAGLG